MSALTITKRKTRKQPVLIFCHNNCRTASGSRKVASHYAWILGRHTPICPACAKAWPVLWDEALGVSERELVAA